MNSVPPTEGTVNSGGWVTPKAMTVSEYASVQREFGESIVCQNEVYWRRNRPFFYRPLLAMEPCSEARITAPGRWALGFQHVVEHIENANSTMNFLVLDPVQGYDLARLSHNRRRLIKQAAKRFQIRPITDPAELKDQGYPAYLSFYRRTGYDYKSERRNKAKFAEWADTVLKQPKAILRGGYGAEGLCAVALSYWVKETLIYTTFFCSTPALRRGVSELIFHDLRELAAAEPGIRVVLVRAYQAGNSRDQYYLDRGCRLVRKPARFTILPLAQCLLKWFTPHQYRQLQGRLEGDGKALGTCGNSLANRTRGTTGIASQYSGEHCI